MIRALALAAAFVVSAQAACAATTASLSALGEPGRVLVLRHATAPGFGDPANFKLRECSTQRNLDAAGRAQAADLGKRLAQAGVKRAKVYSSQWCRCLETARLLALGSVEELPALNSFFGRPEERAPRIAALRAFLAGLPANGPPVVLVTHQVVISALTGHSAASGGGVILQLNGSEAPRLVGLVAAN